MKKLIIIVMLLATNSALAQWTLQQPQQYPPAVNRPQIQPNYQALQLQQQQIQTQQQYQILQLQRQQLMEQRRTR